MKRYLIKIYGIVQGVGFRPFVYNLAIKYFIKGYIKNCGSYVLLDIEGEKSNISNFIIDLLKRPPTLAKIEKVNIKSLTNLNYTEFNIVKSCESEEKMSFVSADVAICNKCLEDIKNPDSRFFNYPFTNCTECGPRFSIIKSLPYDRRNTTMTKFNLCKDCEKDYQDSTNRRFHAEPIACNNCGPKLTLVDNQNQIIQTDDIMKTCSDLIKSGKIVAIKGIGGFHLCCDAKNDQAVLTLREKKHRPDKALAIMAKNINIIREFCFINEVEEKVLLGKEKPIVLLERKTIDHVSKYVAPNNKYLGMFLPYTPLLALLFEYLDLCVMTSGNISDEPIIYENDDALNKLKDIADYFLLNDRDIYMSLDDSVVQVVENQVMVIRLGRGYVPMTYKINSKLEVLACGAEQKSSYAFTQNGYVHLSQYLGDLKDVNTFYYYQDCITKSKDFFNIEPSIYVCDKHPSYLSSKYAKTQQKDIYEVFHHHAHLASCLGENNIEENVIGIIFDGNGLGTDDNIWGGEFIIGNKKEFKRVGHLRYVRIQGMDSANHQIYKIAYCYLLSINKENKLILKNNYPLEIIKTAIKENINCYNSSSIGRLFDAVSCIIGLREEVSYEGQAPIELESLIDEKINEAYSFYITNEDDQYIVSYEEMMIEIIEDLELGKTQSFVSTKFHNTIIMIICEAALLIRKTYKLNKVVLSGGVFQNRYLLRKSSQFLYNLGFDVYYNQKVPINDNGIAFGQVFISINNQKE